ncbi:MAG: twin-arginine translocase TatA/TatE family subunit [Candidatus Binatales bacterium]
MSIVEILVLMVVALVVLGPERLPEVLRTVGKILRELRSVSNELMHELTEALEDPPRRPIGTPESPPPAERIEPNPNPNPPAGQ